MQGERKAKWLTSPPEEDGFWWAKWPRPWSEYREEYVSPQIVQTRAGHIWRTGLASVTPSQAREAGYLFWSLPATPPGEK